MELPDKQVIEWQKLKIKTQAKEIESLKGVENNDSTHRCSFCEDFYASEEKPLRDYKGDPVCNECLIEFLIEMESENEEWTNSVVRRFNDVRDENIKLEEQVNILSKLANP